MQLTIQGGKALSEFRQGKLLTELQSIAPSVVDCVSQYVYFVSLDQSLSENEQQKLCELLRDSSDKEQTLCSDVLILVVPRLGTISPWSSKATDIVRRCGLAAVSRIERGIAHQLAIDSAEIEPHTYAKISRMLHDPMTESVLDNNEAAIRLFDQSEPASLHCVDVISNGRDALVDANQQYGFALSSDEIDYLVREYQKIGRNPTDVELMMFAQVNSEHCRHKIFNAQWYVDDHAKSDSLFDMIRHTHECNSNGTLVAYDDNASVLHGDVAERFFPHSDTGQYGLSEEAIPFLVKVETHNHPTAIAPFPGAATGSGGEIRDEGATGRGGKPKAGITGFTVSHLRLPEASRPWESELKKPSHIASPLQIMLEAPIGGASFNNEFGRPNLGGYFRTFEQSSPCDSSTEIRGYHKPIMIAGGLGNVRPGHVKKQQIPDDAHLIVLGGPSMLIGLGGGAASSMATGVSSEELDFASVQRSNPEMQRRCQEVIDRCWEQGENNPIISIHDVGAGGLSNALPELVNDAGKGAELELRRVLNDEPGMTPMQIWCNEAQERYVLAISPSRLTDFENICLRERCLYSVVGRATKRRQLILKDSVFTNGKDARQATPIDLDMQMLLGKPPKMLRNVDRLRDLYPANDFRNITLDDAIERVLRFPAVADKSFLITIGDRSITGLVCRDQMVGPWQVPVADVAVTAAGHTTYTGEAMAMGERSPVALISPAASARMAVAEAITNIAAAKINDIGDIKLSANWMAAAGQPGQDAALYDAVYALGQEFCPAIGVAIPVGKDSLSMSTQWQDIDKVDHRVTSPLSLNITAFAPVQDVRQCLTPLLNVDVESRLLLIDLGKGQNRLGGSVLAQVYNQMGESAPDIDAPNLLSAFFRAIQTLNHENKILAYHDRSDGGLLTTLLEMSFASRAGLSISLPADSEPLEVLFSEEVGAVVQVRSVDIPAVMACFEKAELATTVHDIGEVASDQQIEIKQGNNTLYKNSRAALHHAWSETSWRIQKLRDNPDCADQEYSRLLDNDDPGISPLLKFDPPQTLHSLNTITAKKPRIAVLREQGVNGHNEMAMAFYKAGFEAIDVTMTDIVDARHTLNDFVGLVACGGFSFGDVLGAGQGWAKSILFNTQLYDEFSAFFQRSDTFALGVCNGCQMFSGLKNIIPGANTWPGFLRNRSEQFEARYVLVEIPQNPSLFFKDMYGSVVPVVVAHGEGQAVFENPDDEEVMRSQQQICLSFVDNHHNPSERYPYNPNGSPRGATGFTSSDGRVTIMMPHPERLLRSVNHSWHPKQWGENGPWLKMFLNARTWVG